MDIVSIRTFLSLAATGSFSRSAESLFVTQPAVSKRIAALEASLGVSLFDRIGKHVQLTEAGHALIPGCERILSEMDESLRILGNLHDMTRGTLSMATSHHIGLHRLPAVLHNYIREYPDVELDIRFMDSEQAFPRILHGEIELAIVTLPNTPLPSLKHIPVWSDPMHCVVSRQHPLATSGKITHKQLLQHAAILQTPGTHTRTLVDTALGDASPRKILLETNYLETIKAMVQAGLGWSMLPDSMIDKSLSTVKISKLKIDRHLGVVIHEKRTLSNAAQGMLNLLQEDQAAHK
jgi:DNA-binding transcriptional LysR family regulator